MTWLSRRVILSAAALFYCLFLLGCSKEAKRADVRGIVKWRGQAPNITGLRISFIGSDNQSVTALVGLNGEYSTNVLSGDNRVVVSWQPPDDQNPFHVPPAQRAPSPDPKSVVNSPIPLRYASPATSHLNCTIEADKTNTYDVDLVD